MTPLFPSPESQYESTTDDWMERKVTISRIPICVSLGLAALKWYGARRFRELPWEWVFAPWWVALYLSAIHNYTISFGKTWLVRCSRVTPFIVISLVALRIFGVPGLSEIGWWVLAAPFWTLTILCWVQLWTIESLDKKNQALSARRTGPQLLVVPSRRLKLLFFTIIVLKWIGISFLAGWSWQWMAVAVALGWSMLCLYNVVILGGERYLAPAYVLFFVTVVLIGWHGLNDLKLDLTWVVIFLPSVFYGLFCWVIVLPRIHDLNRRLERRNDYVSKCIDSGAAPVPIKLESEPEMVSAPLPGNDSRFHLSSLVILTTISFSLNTVLGLIVGWSFSKLLSWILNYNWIIAALLPIMLSILTYWWVLVPVAFLFQRIAKWCNCAHRPTLWFVSVVSSIAVIFGFVIKFGDFLQFSFGDIFLMIYVLTWLFSSQAGALGLMAVFTPVNEQTSSL